MVDCGAGRSGSTINAMRPLLLLIRTGKKEFREYLLRSITQHYRVHLFTVAELTWEPAYIDGHTRVDTADVAAMVKAAQELKEVAGVLCWDEQRIIHTGEVARALGLPGDPAATARCRDKSVTRQALAAAGVPQPGSAQVESLEEALKTAHGFGYPVIIKPTDLALSAGVMKVADDEQMTTAYEWVSGMKYAGEPDWRPRILVEEFAVGEEISIDTAVHAGEIYPLCLAHKEIGYPPYCIEVGHFVFGDEPLLADPRLIQVLRDVHSALGVRDGITHSEIMLTASGPKIIEVNGRLGGDMIPYLGLRATGIDTGLAAAAVACGQTPTVRRDRSKVAAVRFFYPPKEDTHIESLRFDFGSAGAPDAIDQLAILVEPGAVKSPPPRGIIAGRMAFATAVADTAGECRQALDAAEKALHLNC